MSDNLKENVELLSDCSKSLFLFTSKVFSKSFSNFIGGPYIEESCNYLSKYDRTMKIAARSHFKSTGFYSKIMSDIMFRGIKEDLDIQYFSYNESLAGWHIGQIKTLIDRNPYFAELINLKPLAENVAAYTWDRKHIIRIHPRGIISFSRGSKSNYIYLDDIYSDPSSIIHPTIILKINDIFRGVILESLKPGGEIHIIGSPLSRADLYFDPELQKEFHFRSYPGIVKDEQGNEVPSWPEFYTLEQLKAKILVMGEKAFSAEIQCEPFYSADSFFKKEQMRKTVVNPQLRNIPLAQGLDTQNLVVAGLDIGKKKHPSDFSVFLVSNGKAIMVHHKVMVKWPYFSGKPFDHFHPTQVEYCKEAIKNFGIDQLYFDNTRGEFEGAKDSGLLTPHFVPIVFTPKMKVQMATGFEKVVLNRQVELLDDEDLLNSICSVTNDLQKIESASGSHGDCYDDKTEVLTKEGWKLFKDITLNDEIATLKNKEYLEYHKPQKIIVEDYEGKMYRIKGFQIDLLVSPRHRMYVGSTIWNQHQKYRWKIRKPKDIFHLQVYFKKDFKWNGKYEEWFELPKTIVDNKNRKHQERNLKKRILMNNWLAFLGIYLAEGDTPPERNEIRIWQSQGESYQEMIEILEKLPFKFSKRKRSLTICSKQLAIYTKTLGRYSYLKYIPTEFKQLPKKQLKILFDALILGDGCKTYANTLQERLHFASTSKRLIDDMQEIGLKLGYTSNVLTYNNIGRKAPHGETRRLSYTLNFFKQIGPTMINKDSRKGKFLDSWVDYKGKIYDVTVPNHILYVRRNGKTVWSGNSFDSVGLALLGFEKMGASGKMDKELSSGATSIFDGGKMPKDGWSEPGFKRGARLGL